MSQQQLISFWQESLKVTPKRIRKYPRGICPDCGEHKALEVMGLCRKCYDIRKNKARKYYDKY